MPAISPCAASVPRKPCTPCTLHILARNNRTSTATYMMRMRRPNSLAAGVYEFDMGRPVYRRKSSLLDRRGSHCAGFRTRRVYNRGLWLGLEDRGVSMLTRWRIAGFYSLRALACMLIALSPLTAQAGQNYQIYVSNEKSGDVTVISGSDNQVLGTNP